MGTIPEPNINNICPNLNTSYPAKIAIDFLYDTLSIEAPPRPLLLLMPPSRTTAINRALITRNIQYKDYARARAAEQPLALACLMAAAPRHAVSISPLHRAAAACRHRSRQLIVTAAPSPHRPTDRTTAVQRPPSTPAEHSKVPAQAPAPANPSAAGSQTKNRGTRDRGPLDLARRHATTGATATSTLAVNSAAPPPYLYQGKQRSPSTSLKTPSR